MVENMPSLGISRATKLTMIMTLITVGFFLNES